MHMHPACGEPCVRVTPPRWFHHHDNEHKTKHIPVCSNIPITSLCPDSEPGTHLNASYTGKYVPLTSIYSAEMRGLTD